MQQIKWKFIGCKHKGDGGLVKWQKHRKEEKRAANQRRKLRFSSRFQPQPYIEIQISNSVLIFFPKNIYSSTDFFVTLLQYCRRSTKKLRIFLCYMIKVRKRLERLATTNCGEYWRSVYASISVFYTQLLVGWIFNVKCAFLCTVKIRKNCKNSQE